MHFAGNIGYFQQENSLSKGVGSSGMLGARYTNLARVKKGAAGGRGPLQGVKAVTSAERHNSCLWHGASVCVPLSVLFWKASEGSGSSHPSQCSVLLFKGTFLPVLSQKWIIIQRAFSR